MRVVQLVTRLIVGGAQRIVLETAAALRARQIDAEIWCGPQSGPEGSLAPEAAQRGVPIRIVPDLVKEIDPIRDLAALRWLARELCAARPDLVHTHSSKAGILGRRAARTAGVPRVLHTVHGWGFSHRTPILARIGFVAAERAASRWADAIVAVSERVRDDGLARGIGRREIYEVIRPGIDLAPYADLGEIGRRGRALRRELGIDEGALLAGTIGRLAPQKNPAMILEAAARIPDLHWLLVGDGPLRASVEERIARLGIRDRVHLAGLRTDIAGCLGALDLFVLVSLWEGLPLTLLEARAAGIPIVAAAVGGVAEIVPAPPAGRCIPPGEIEPFLRAIESWRTAREEARRAALRNRECSAGESSRERMIEQILGLYHLDETGR